jgi:hypothetical protein
MAPARRHLLLVVKDGAGRRDLPQAIQSSETWRKNHTPFGGGVDTTSAFGQN